MGNMFSRDVGSKEFQDGTACSVMFNKYNEEAVRFVKDWMKMTNQYDRPFPDAGSFDKNILDTVQTEIEKLKNPKTKLIMKYCLKLWKVEAEQWQPIKTAEGVLQSPKLDLGDSETLQSVKLKQENFPPPYQAFKPTTLYPLEELKQLENYSSTESESDDLLTENQMALAIQRILQMQIVDQGVAAVPALPVDGVEVAGEQGAGGGVQFGSSITDAVKRRVHRKPVQLYDPATGQTYSKIYQINKTDTKQGGVKGKGSVPLLPIRRMLIPRPDVGDPPVAQQPLEVPLHVSWTCSELRNMIKDCPNPKTDLLGCQKFIRGIGNAHEPTGRDWRVFLRAILPEGIDIVTFFTNSALANDNLPCVDDVANQTNITNILTQLRVAFPPRVDWQKLFTIKQKTNESGEEYCMRVAVEMSNYTGIENVVEAVEHRQMAVAVLVEGLVETLRNRLQIATPEWRGKTFVEIKELIINHDVNISKKKEDLKNKLLTVQLRTLGNQTLPRTYNTQFGCEPHLKMIGRCYTCGQEGHYSYCCPSLGRGQRGRGDGMMMRGLGYRPYLQREGRGRGKPQFSGPYTSGSGVVSNYNQQRGALGFGNSQLQAAGTRVQYSNPQ